MTAAPAPAVSVAASHQRYALILPGNWASLPMDDDERLRDRVRQLVKERTPRDDRFATARKNMRDELLGNATAAKDAGARLYALSLELLPGLPFPASLIMYDMEWPPGVARDEEDEARLAAAFAELTPVPTAPRPTRRSAEIREKTLSDGEMTRTVLDLTYWFAAPSAGLVCAMVSVPDCPAPEEVTRLFDMIASSIHWAPGDGS